MPNLKGTVQIDLSLFFRLMTYYEAARYHPDIGELGLKSFAETLKEVGEKSPINLSPTLLEHIVYHAKQAILDHRVWLPDKLRTYHPFMEALQQEVPELFKKKKGGEIVFIDFKDKEDLIGP